MPDGNVQGVDVAKTVDAPVPDTTSLRTLAAAAADCTACELYRDASQVVFGAGPRSAQLILVGEQPGDVEDKEGEPFVGPAGRILDRALASAGVDRSAVYLTNAVKHFRWTPAERGKRRLHKTPAMQHVRACHPWLAAELAAVRPRVVVAMGATACGALFEPGFKLTAHRGERLDWPREAGPFAGDRHRITAAFATIHPSAVLRGDPDRRDELLAGLAADLAAAAAVAAETAS